MSDHAELVRQLCDVAVHTTGDVRRVVAAAADHVAPLAAAHERAALIDAAVARLDGLDALEPYLRDPTVDEVIVNRGTDIWIERAGGLLPAGTLPPGAIDVVLQRILSPTGRRLDRSNPVIDTRLADGARVCAAVPPVAVDGTTVAIRKHRLRRVALHEFGAPPVVDLIRELVRRRANVLVSGGTSSGKTTLLAAALATVPPDERLVLIEDTAEITLADHHLVRLETRPPTADGVRAIDTIDLVRAALRMRPDRLVTGEFRGDEALAVVQALNTGHDGSWATCHANSALDALDRLATLVLHAAPTWPMASIRSQVSRSIDAVIHLRRVPGGGREVTEIVEPIPTGGEPDGVTLANATSVMAEPERRRR